MDNFNGLGLPQPLEKSLARMNYTKPTEVQELAIPPALEGRDILGSAQTGTGKTAAFGIPLVAKLMQNSRGSALIMTPTRELATQVQDIITSLVGGYAGIKTALLIGGDSMPKQLAQLRARPRVIVGTPGRINDHLVRGSLMLHDTGFLVLDETDRMLDMGFSIQIERIMKYLPQQRQTLLFSATLPKNIVGMSQKFLKDPVRVSVGGESKPVTNIKQETITVSESEKYNQLLKQLDERQGSVIIFVKTKWGAEKLATRLSKNNHSADAIHGDLRQNQRDRVILNFRNQKHRVMVATDIAARGLDIPHIEHVINYDLPQCPEDYIHRIGRTARNGAEGAAVNLISPEDGAKWKAIHKLLHPNEKQAPKQFGSRRSEGGDSAPRGDEKPAGRRGGRPFRFRNKAGAGGGGSGGQRRSSAPKAA